jgi:hypothetical protein
MALYRSQDSLVGAVESLRAELQDRKNPRDSERDGQAPTGTASIAADRELMSRLERIERQLTVVARQFEDVPEAAPADSDEFPRFHGTEEVEAMIQELDKTPTARQLASALTTLDSWFIAPPDEEAVQKAKAGLVGRLREQVKKQVVALQKSALSAANGSQAVEKHGEAAEILLLYPMAEDKAVLEEVRRLATQQADVAARIEVLRRQRYNHWAMDRIEAALKGFHENSKYLSPKQENAALVASLVKNLGDVDPSLIEPAVLDLYNYVFTLTKDSISEIDKIELGKRLSDPANKRKILGDF